MCVIYIYNVTEWLTMLSQTEDVLCIDESD